MQGGPLAASINMTINNAPAGRHFNTGVLGEGGVGVR